MEPVALSNFENPGRIAFSLFRLQTCNNLSVLLLLPQEKEIMKEIQDNGPVQGNNT